MPSKRDLVLVALLIVGGAIANIVILLRHSRNVEHALALELARPMKRMLPWRTLSAASKSNATVLDVQTQVKLLFGIFTLRELVEGHDTIRQTWMRQPGVCTIVDPFADSCKVVVAFVTGGNAAKVEVKGDFLILNISENMNTGKSYFFFYHAARAFSWATHIGKLDMDSFPFLPKLFAMVPTLAQAPYAYLGYPHTFYSCGGGCECPPRACVKLMANTTRFWQANCWTYMSGSLYILSRPLAEEVSRKAGHWDQHKTGDEDMMTGHAVVLFAVSRGVEVKMWNLTAAGSMFAPFGAWRHTGGVNGVVVATGLWGEGTHDDGDLGVLERFREHHLALYGDPQGLKLLRRARFSTPIFQGPHNGGDVSFTEWNVGQHFPCSEHSWLLEQQSTEMSSACARGAKLNMLLQAARAYPGMEWYLWLDPKKSVFSPEDIMLANENAVAKFAHNQIVVAAFPNCSACGPSWSACYCVAGSYLLVPWGVLEEAAEMFNAKVLDCLGSGLAATAALSSCLDDKVILTRMLQERPSLFQVLGEEGELTGAVFYPRKPDRGRLIDQLFQRMWSPERPAIYWRPEGRLGNIMFGYASLLGIAHQNGMDHFIMADHCGAPCEDPWSCWWEAESLTACGITQLFSLPVRSVPSELEKRAQLFQDFKECGHARFDKTLFYLPPVTILHGYFQSWRYFAAVSEKVRETFRAPETARRAAEKRRQATVPRNSSTLVCLQVRREDKRNLPQYKLPSRRYYEEAKAEIYKRLQLEGRPVDIAVTTADVDDASWVQNSFRDWKEEVHVSASASPLDDFLFLQTACDVLVLGSSTFAWWAAYTSERARLIIAPSAIFIPSHPLILEFRSDDYYPPSWLLIAPD